MSLTMLNEKNDLREFMIVLQNPNVKGSYPKVVCAYDSASHICLMTAEEAESKARKLAVSHPGVTYAVVRLAFSIVQSPADAMALRKSVGGEPLMGDLYTTVGAGESRGTQFLG